MEAALVDLAGELDGFFAVSGELLSIADSDGCLRRLNAAWENGLGFSREELLGRSLLDFVHAEDLQATSDALAQLSTSYAAVTFTNRCRTKQGGYRWLAWRALASGGLIYAAAQDVTERRILEEAARSATETAEAAKEARAAFLARINHDFRAPVNAIVGQCQLALRTQLTPRQRDYLSKLQSSAYMLANSTNNLLDLALLKSGGLALERVAFRVDHLLSAVASTVSSRAQDKGLGLVVSAGPGVPRRLLGDSVRLGQVLANLAGNAVKYTSHGRVSISTELLDQTPTGATVRFAVRDTGIGMDPACLGRAVEPGTQAGPPEMRADGGLGLFISSQLVGLMGGELQAESRPGSDTIFWFDLDFGVPPKRTPSVKTLPVDLRGRHVLLADANRADRDAMAAGLSALGFQVAAVDTGEDALAALTGPGPAYDVVLVDADLPGQGSLEVIRRLRCDLRLPVLPRIVLLTSPGQQASVEQMDRFSPDGLAIKPVSQSDLFDTLMAALGREAEATPSPGPPAGTDAGRRALAGTRLLVVEDNIINQRVAREILQSRGATVEVVANGREAVETLRHDPQRFDAVLMDLQMPGMDGYAATRAIRQEWPALALPVIAVTANAVRSEQAACLEAGMNDYLSKPIDPKRLEAVLRHWTHPPSAGSLDKPDHPAPPAAVEVPQLDVSGVDMASALARLNGSHQLLVRLLRTFAHDHEHAGEAIADALRRDDIETAVGLTHTLKGVAGTLSVTAVYEATCELELAIRQGPGDRCNQHLERLNAALDVVCRAVKELGDRTTRPAPTGARLPAQAGRLAVLLGEFDALLKKRRFSARQQFEQIKEHATATELREGLVEIQACLDHLDFQRARGRLPGLARALGVTFTPA